MAKITKVEKFLRAREKAKLRRLKHKQEFARKNPRLVALGKKVAAAENEFFSAVGRGIAKGAKIGFKELKKQSRKRR